MRLSIVVGVLVALVQVAAGDVVISEWMYSGTDGEFVEFTNVGATPVDMTNWSYSDTDAEPGDVSFFDVFGVVQPGESVIFTEAEPALFRAAWGLGAGVKIFGPNTDSNLGRNDQINLYDADGNLADQLSYGDQDHPGTPRTQNRSCNIPGTDYGYDVAQTTWVLASDGDEYGSWKSAGFDTGSPGQLPEPATLALLLAGGLLVGRRR
ncbi:MAG TPA: lamin tail domain-containing protein [Phycisphaerae bacterium]|nr:lamin tail domain-containing protein [Phycisphaerae bacterium]HNU44384.1 lamin tail domain-containing protein [Phycisphaerae bacterium]